MSKKENFVTNGDSASVTPVPNIPEYYKNEFFKSINDFLESEELHILSNLQNDMLTTYIEKENLSKEQIVNAVYFSNSQSIFLLQLKTKWENFIKFNNVSV